MRYQVSINMHQGSSITLRWVWMYIPFLRFACQVCIRFSECKKNRVKKRSSRTSYIYHLRAPAIIIIKCWSETHESCAITNTRVVTHLIYNYHRIPSERAPLHISNVWYFQQPCYALTLTFVSIYTIISPLNRDLTRISCINRSSEMLHFIV